MTRTNVLLTALATFAGGFVAGLILAPQSGRDARGALAQKLRAQTQRLEAHVHAVEAHIEEVEAHLQHSGEALGSRVKGALDVQVAGALEEDAWSLEQEDLARDLRQLPRG